MGKLAFLILPVGVLILLTIFFFGKYNTPEYVTTKFYNWYLENRLPNDSYKNSTELSTELVLFMADFIENSDYKGDAFLCTHLFNPQENFDIDRFEVIESFSLDNTEELVGLKLFPVIDPSYDSLYKDDERYYFMTLGVKKINSNWKVSNIYCSHIKETKKLIDAASTQNESTQSQR